MSSKNLGRSLMAFMLLRLGDARCFRGGRLDARI